MKWINKEAAVSPLSGGEAFSNTFILGPSWFDRFREKNGNFEYMNDESGVVLVYDGHVHILTFFPSTGKVSTDLPLNKLEG